MARISGVLSHWHTLIDIFNTSSLDFYEAVEEAVSQRELPDLKFGRVMFKERGLASAKREYLRIRRENVAFDICAAPYGKGFFFSWWLVRPGPKHPWAWLLGTLFAFAVWLSILLGTLSATLEEDSLSQVAGCLGFLFLLASLPTAVVGMAFGIRQGYILDEEIVMDLPWIGWLYVLLFNPQTYYRLDTALMFRDSVARAVNEVINGLLEEKGLRALSADELKPTVRDLAR